MEAVRSGGDSTSRKFTRGSDHGAIGGNTNNSSFNSLFAKSEKL